MITAHLQLAQVQSVRPVVDRTGRYLQINNKLTALSEGLNVALQPAFAAIYQIITLRL